MTDREEFEAWWYLEMNTQAMDLHRCEFPITEAEKQPYACHETQRSWLTWQAARRLTKYGKPVMSVEELDIAIDEFLQSLLDTRTISYAAMLGALRTRTLAVEEGLRRAAAKREAKP